MLAAKERPAQVASLDDPELKIELWNTPDNLDVSRTSNTIFGLSQRFPYPGKRALKRSLTEKDAETVTAQIRAKEREIAAQVKGTYYELFLAHKAIEIHHRQIELLKDFFEIANARFRAGKGAQVDVLKSAVELSKLTNELPVLEQQQESAHDQQRNASEGEIEVYDLARRDLMNAEEISSRATGLGGARPDRDD